MHRGWSILAVVVTLTGAPLVQAQVPTADQLELLKSMSPEDREALMSQLGLDGASREESSSGQSADARARDRQQTRQPRDIEDEVDFAMKAREAKTFKPDDSLLIETVMLECIPQTLPGQCRVGATPPRGVSPVRGVRALDRSASADTSKG